jgi:hypothetical protein
MAQTIVLGRAGRLLNDDGPRERAEAGMFTR